MRFWKKLRQAIREKMHPEKTYTIWLDDETSDNINELLSRLRQKISEKGIRSFFNPPASRVQIAKLEKTLGRKLPASVRSFYLSYNGGYFADKDWSDEDLNNRALQGMVPWNSNYILSVEDVIKSYLLEEGSYSLHDFREIEEHYENKYMPLLHTSGQELFVIDISDPEDQCQVLDAWHESWPDGWGVLYDSFEDFLEDYIEKEGDIETIAGGGEEE